MANLKLTTFSQAAYKQDCHRLCHRVLYLLSVTHKTPRNTPLSLKLKFACQFEIPVHIKQTTVFTKVDRRPDSPHGVALYTPALAYTLKDTVISVKWVSVSWRLSHCSGFIHLDRHVDIYITCYLQCWASYLKK